MRCIMPTSTNRPIKNLYALACLVLVIAALYFGRTILVPVVLAFLLTFLLAPGMLALERRGLSRALAAGICVFSTLLVLLGLTLILSGQIRSLMRELPNHREEILAKVELVQEHVRES